MGDTAGAPLTTTPAGKSTTFKILTGELLPDEGDARIAGHSVLLSLQQARQRLGYCPQVGGWQQLRAFDRVHLGPAAAKDTCWAAAGPAAAGLLPAGGGVAAAKGV